MGFAWPPGYADCIKLANDDTRLRQQTLACKTKSEDPLSIPQLFCCGCIIFPLGNLFLSLSCPGLNSYCCDSATETQDNLVQYPVFIIMLNGCNEQDASKVMSYSKVVFIFHAAWCLWNAHSSGWTIQLWLFFQTLSFFSFVMKYYFGVVEGFCVCVFVLSNFVTNS